MEKCALSGITVLDLSRLLPGPYASMILADHGARVIAIEDRRFAGESMKNNTINRNKQHITLNLKTEKGREIFFKLAGSADIVLEGFRPGVTRRLGVDYESIARVNPCIIYCSITGYGQTGPYSDLVGHDVNYLSIAGVIDLIGPAGGPPVIPGIQIADMAGGGMNAVIGILMALHARQQTGKGQYIDISMTDGSLSLLSLALNMQQASGEPMRRSDSYLSGRYACYSVYQTKDDRYLSIGAVENRFWRQLCEFFKVPEFTPLQYDKANQDRIFEFFCTTFKTRALSEWEEVLAGLEICWAPVRHMEEAIADPLFAEREMVVPIDHPEKEPLTALGTPIKLSETKGRVQSPPPEFGEDTVGILSSLGYSDQEIESFQKDGVI